MKRRAEKTPLIKLRKYSAILFISFSYVYLELLPWPYQIIESLVTRENQSAKIINGITFITIYIATCVFIHLLDNLQKILRIFANYVAFFY